MTLNTVLGGGGLIRQNKNLSSDSSSSVHYHRFPVAVDLPHLPTDCSRLLMCHMTHTCYPLLIGSSMYTHTIPQVEKGSEHSLCCISERLFLLLLLFFR